MRFFVISPIFFKKSSQAAKVFAQIAQGVALPDQINITQIGLAFKELSQPACRGCVRLRKP
jgi:hypothetical protein